MSIIATMLLFVVLQPGILLTLPAVGRSVFMSGKMSVQAVFVHALVFALVLHFLRRGGYFAEGFAGPMGQLYPNAAPWTVEGFAATATPTESVVKETAAYAIELVSPKINPVRITSIQNYVTPKSKDAKLKQIDRTLYMTIVSMIPAAKDRISNSASMPKPTQEALDKTKQIASALISPTISVKEFNTIKTRVLQMVNDSKNPADRMLYYTVSKMIEYTESRLPASTSSSSRVAAISPVSSIRNAIATNVSMGMPLSNMAAGSRGSSSSLARLPPGITPAQAAILGLKI